MQVIKVFTNAADLSAYAGYAVKQGTGGVVVCTAITDQAIGIITKGGTTSSDVCIFGECAALAGGTVTVGKHIIPHTDSTVKDTTSSSQEFALALESGVAGDWVNVFVLGSNKAVA